jgi:hypothetical protein
MEIELRKCGDRVTFSLPTEVVAQLGWGPGDICRCEIDGEALGILRTETLHDRAMKFARRAMVTYREAFEALAKS